MYSDPLKGRNPFAVARMIRSGNAPCPVCGNRCSIVTSVRGDDVICTASCTNCGVSDLEVFVNESSDVEITYKGSPYYATFEELKASDTDKSDERARCAVLSDASAACVHKGRPGKAIALGKEVTETYRSKIGTGGWEDAPRLCISSAVRTAEAISGQGDPTDAVEFLERYIDVADADSSSARVEFHIALALTHLQAGDPAESVKDLRSIIEGLKDPLPEGDRFIRIRANEALGTLLETKPDHAGAIRAFNTAVKECNSILTSEPSDECLRLLCRVSGEYAESAYNGKAEKKGTEAIKLAVKTCRNLKDRFPGAYAEALLQRARYLNTLDAIDPGLRDSMDEAITILAEPDSNGRYDRLLPLAYYYRSASSGKKDSLDIEDLAKAYEILRDDLVSGTLPDGVMYSVSETYVQYLDLFDRPRSAEVRSELAGLGFVFPPPPELKEEKSSE